MASGKDMLVEYGDDGVCWITFNRPEKYNAISYDVYDIWMPALKAAEEREDVKMIVLTGNGKYFTSGNDQSNMMRADTYEHRNDFRDLIDMLIDMKKPMVALVNGPAVGMGVTILSHCDLVIASDTATFLTPFTRLALNAEGCSSYMFPRIMGYSKAAEMLLLNKKATAQEMYDWGLVSRVIPHDQFKQQTRAMIAEMSQLPPKALMAGKALIRPTELKEKLHKINKKEVEVLAEMMGSPEAMEVVMKFLNNRKKSKL